MYDSHMHTPLCHHAIGSPCEYAEAAQLAGLTGIIFTCHNPLPDGISQNVRMAPDEFEQYLNLIHDTHQQWEGLVDVRLGLECDYMPQMGLETWFEEQAKAADYDYLLVSIHPHLSEYRDRFWKNDPVAYQKIYFDHLAEAAELGLHDALAHPDLVKNVTADAWGVLKIIDSIRHCLDRIAKTGLAMELNTSGWNKTVAEQNPGSLILKEIAMRSIPIVLGSDAHEPARVGDRFLKALDLVEETGFTQISFFLHRHRQDVSIAEARSGLTDRIKKHTVT